MDRMTVNPTLAFIAAAPLCKVEWDVHGSDDQFLYHYKTGKLFRVGDTEHMLRKLTDGVEEESPGTETIHSIYREEFAMCCMSFDFANAARLQFLDKKKTYCFKVPSIAAQKALRERSSIPAVSFVNESQVSPSTAAVTDNADNDNDDWDLKNAVGLVNVERFDKIGACIVFRKAKNLELHTAPGLIEEATKPQNEGVKLLHAVFEHGANFAVMSGLRKEVSAVK